MEDLSLHILDIAENSIAAGSNRIKIKILENTIENFFRIEISDNGKGMDKDTIKKAHDPFFTSKPNKRVGLGISLLEQAAKEGNGNMDIISKKGEGTTIIADFQHNHIDRKPLGDIEKTLIVLIAGNPGCDFVFEHERNNLTYSIDTSNIKNKLQGIPVNDPGVIKYIKDGISKWLNDTKSFNITDDSGIDDVSLSNGKGR